MAILKRFLIVAAVLITGAAAASLPQAQAQEDAGQFLKALQVEAMGQLSDNDVPSEEREKKFRDLLNKNFDVEGIARFVVGRYWRKADTAARKEFVSLFEEVMVQRFLPTFSDYAEADFQVTAVRERKDYFVVTSSVKAPNGEPASILWRIIKDGNGYIITDVAAEGISLRTTYREDYTSALRSVGGDLAKFNEKLREKVNSGAFAPKKG